MDHSLTLPAACAASALVTAVVVGFALWPRAKVDERLLGTWQSDTDATVNEWRERRPLTDEQAEQLRTVFGPTRITWGQRTFTMTANNERAEHSYQVVATNEVAVVIRTWSVLEQRDGFVTITFVDADTYWLYEAEGPLRKYFRRVG